MSKEANLFFPVYQSNKHKKAFKKNGVFLHYIVYLFFEDIVKDLV